MMEVSMRIVAGAIKGSAIGAVTGVGVAVIMISLVQLRPFSIPINGIIERASVRLCPLFILGFWSGITNTAELFAITIMGNAIIYGALFALIAVGEGVLRKIAAHWAS
jgi:hypothetical protein